MVLTSAESRSASWVAALFALMVVFQRVAIPALNVSALVIVAVLWAGLGLIKGVVEIDSTRMCWWLAAGVVTGFLMFVQTLVVAEAQISITAWGLVLVVWLPFVVRLVTRSLAAYIVALRKIANITTALAVASLAMLAVQFAGVNYSDWFGAILPHSLQLSGFSIAYPLYWSSPIYKSNAFIGLEPSIVSLQLGVGILAVIIARVQWWKLIVLLAGIAATVAGSGMIVVLVGLVVIFAGSGSRGWAGRHLAFVLTIAVAAWFTPPGQLIFGRVNEFGADQSSASARSSVPYKVLLPEWLKDLGGLLVGHGPGSSQRTVDDLTTVYGALVPTPLKVMFEYGLIGGIVLGAFLLMCYWGAPSLALAVALLVSTGFLQSGLASPVITLPTLALVTAWSPRMSSRPLEWNSQNFAMSNGPPRLLRRVGHTW
jgi:hypothetical protein